MNRILKKLSPPQIIAISFLVVILIGAALLDTPFANSNGKPIGFLNALFTATSATCVTGLVVVTTFDSWTWFGKFIILALIQVGALGALTILNLGVIFLKKKMTLEDHLVIQASFNQDTIGDMGKLVKNVVLISFFIEAIGIVLLALSFYVSSPISLHKAIY
jgi:trk system potassium uptake protein TrkH